MKHFLRAAALFVAALAPVFAQVPQQSGATNSADINIASGTVQIIAAPNAGAQVRVYVLDLSVATPGTAGTWSVVAGTGSNCGTGQTTLLGPYFGATYSREWGGAVRAPQGAAVCITSTVALGGGVSWATY
jgi:hypothetical protein